MTCVLRILGYYLDSENKCISFIEKIQTIENCRLYSFSIGNISFSYNSFPSNDYIMSIDSITEKLYFDYEYFNGIVTDVKDTIKAN